MSIILLSAGNRPVADDIGGVIMSVLLTVFTLALIYGVLVLIDRRYKKNIQQSDKKDEPEKKEHTYMSFPQVLSDEIKKNSDNNDKDGIGRA
ncbi:MAG: hypothetical protein J6X60_02895 [Ruminiclostridium sp.]|nr:hypothetical protein [Ruminiclostridium sp.]